MHTYFGGCDVGSTTGKAVVLDEKGNIVGSSIVPSEIDPEITAVNALEQAGEQIADLGHYKALAWIVGTGYGRNEVPFANQNISEISCHAMGTFCCNTAIRTIVDIIPRSLGHWVQRSLPSAVIMHIKKEAGDRAQKLLSGHFRLAPEIAKTDARIKWNG